MYHGLSAYNKATKHWTSLLDRAKTAQTVQCCWSDTPLGPIGLFCDPDHADIMSKGCHHDSYSNIDEYGDRCTQDDDAWYQDGAETNYQFYRRISAKVDLNHRRKSYRYAEFTAEAEADAVWITDKKWLYQGKMLSCKMGLPLMRLY